MQSNYHCIGAVRYLQRIPEKLINRYSKYKYTQKHDIASSKIMFIASNTLTIKK